MLVLDRISFSFKGAEVLREIGFALQPGRLVALLGINGAGKSTLLRTINGLLPPQQGTVLIDDIPLTRLSGREVARRVGYLPQKSNGTAVCTVFDAVLLGRKPHFSGSPAARDLKLVEQTLHTMGLERLALRDTSRLSGGELQRVMIARALVQEPRVLLLDEPINHLDIKNQLATMSLLKRLTTELNLVTVVVLHDLSAALRFADRFVLLQDGRLYACGDRRVMNETAMREVFGMEALIREVEGIPVVLPLAPCTP
ncbi:MAG TPA: ABC transporter ATP-binding protein [Desulfurivibrio alkaliphilus]|uniref:ABC transporter ATP-binding protein n=1 Tax=Desulfurivibrio alkaliphilus TaxID=427923 RepID=A0A7C2THB2_9BACT|nr:ABC transporter ATP-binding protein [Desulfurivibrio alkaliphilus]